MKGSRVENKEKEVRPEEVQLLKASVCFVLCAGTFLLAIVRNWRPSAVYGRRDQLTSALVPIGALCVVGAFISFAVVVALWARLPN